MVVLYEIDCICRRNNIQYFADWGTLLGAVRHKGFIPWDDDMDIVMKRSDYQRFLQIAERELPQGYCLHTPERKIGYPNSFARVVNSHDISFTPKRMEEFYGCPYVVGIDIFPLDIIPRIKQEEDIQYQIMIILRGALTQIQEKGDQLEKVLLQLEELLQVKIDRAKDIQQQILILVDRISQLYQEKDGDEYTLLSYWPSHRELRFKKEWYSKAIEMPFENISIPVPIGYDNILKVMYGDYQAPVKNTSSHDYPFYRAQQEALEDYLKAQ